MPAELVIDGKVINTDSDCYIIAEVGHNHQGDLEKAKQLFAAAKQCGVDAVKLQKRNNRVLFTKAQYDKPYENENSFGPTYGLHREALEFGKSEYVELRKCAKELELTLFATPFDFPSVDFLAELDMPAYKTASGDLKNLPLLRYIAKLGKPMIVSTGGAALDDVRRAHDAIMAINTKLALLQCTAAYPASHEDLNLRVIQLYQKEFPRAVVGLSDHENGIAMAMAAFVLGARIIEQHFTLNHTMKGTDHVFSLEPIGMRKLARDLRRVRLALGDGVKRPLPSEASALVKMGKKLVAARALPAGTRLTDRDVAIKSPGDGLPPYELEKVIGKRLSCPLQEDQNITFEVLKD